LNKASGLNHYPQPASPRGSNQFESLAGIGSLRESREAPDGTVLHGVCFSSWQPSFTGCDPSKMRGIDVAGQHFRRASVRVIMESRGIGMSFPIKTCVICSEEFELRPDKPGFANRCPACSAPESESSSENRHVDASTRRAESELNEVRRRTIRDMLYRKES